jgi:hypothetical protein
VPSGFHETLNHGADQLLIHLEYLWPPDAEGVQNRTTLGKEKNRVIEMLALILRMF